MGAAEPRFFESRRQPDLVFHHSQRLGYIEKQKTEKKPHPPTLLSKMLLELFETTLLRLDSSLQHKVAEPDLSLRLRESRNLAGSSLQQETI